MFKYISIQIQFKFLLPFKIRKHISYSHLKKDSALRNENVYFKNLKNIRKS